MSKVYSILLKNILMPLADGVMHTKIIHYYNMIIQMQNWSSGKINDWQNERLQDLIHHAYNNTKYYKRIFNENGINPNDIKTIEDLKKIPILTKDIIRNNYNKLIPKNLISNTYKFSSTGGSTGNPLKFLLDKRSWSYSNADNIYNWEKIGYNYGDKYIALGSTSLFVNKSVPYKHKIYYKLKNKIGLNAINMSDEVCKKYINLIKKKKIKYIYGYASSIYLLAKYSLKNNIPLNIIACFPTSEILTDLYRDTIINAFVCKVLNCYGAHDGGITAFEHEKGYFKVGYNSLITIKKKDKNNTGPAFLTDLFNYAMPFINYQLGDELQIDESKNKEYPYNGQIINHVYGRTSDVLRIENGNILTGPGFTVLFKDLPVKAYRIKKTNFKKVICEVIQDNNFKKEHEDIILGSLQKQAGEGIKISINYVDDFELKSSGKREYFLSE